jgi:hypothetical protein
MLKQIEGSRAVAEAAATTYCPVPADAIRATLGVMPWHIVVLERALAPGTSIPGTTPTPRPPCAGQAPANRVSGQGCAT